MSQPKDKMSEIDEHIMKRFDIQKRLGKGAYGIVWKAVDRRTKEVVAVKKIFDAFRNQTDAQRTFREIMFLQSFKMHPNIVKLHSIHRAANNRDIYLGFEYMETDLHNVIKRGNILKDVHKSYIMYQLLKAMNFIHSGNVIHRDMKPSNVLLDSSCKCKVADFGLARSVNPTADDAFSECDPALTDYVATRWYRAPEILIANRRYTKGIDMWSLGCILAELQAGRPIFPGTSTVNQVERIMASIPTPTPDEIALVCPTGVGASMIKNAASAPKVQLQTLLGNNVQEDALQLINKLLVFNPLKRFTAEEALRDVFVKKFHEPDRDLVMNASVIIPLSDNVRLSVDEYRNKLYELMQNNNQVKFSSSRVNAKVAEMHPRISRSTEKYLRAHSSVKPYVSISEPKISNASKSNLLNAATVKSECKVTKQNLQVVPEHRCYKAGGDYMKSKTLKSHTEVPKKRFVPHKADSYSTSFNSYNRNHGIITQSALMELRAAGLR